MLITKNMAGIRGGTLMAAKKDLKHAEVQHATKTSHDGAVDEPRGRESAPPPTQHPLETFNFHQRITVSGDLLRTEPVRRKAELGGKSSDVPG